MSRRRKPSSCASSRSANSRLGGTRVLRTDARVVAATNRDLLRAISNNQFREDLFYRLNVFAIPLPALRDRRDDILPLSEAFLTEVGKGIGRPPADLHPMRGSSSSSTTGPATSASCATSSNARPSCATAV